MTPSFSLHHIPARAWQYVVVSCVLSCVGNAAEPVFHLESRRLFDEGQTPRAQGAHYVHPTGVELMAIDRRSTDNGRNWIRALPFKSFDANLRAGFRRSTLPGFVDPVEDRILSLTLALDVTDLDPNIIEPPIGENEFYVRYRVSIDGGKTFLFDEPIIQEGDYNQRHPIEDVYLGKNGYYLGDVGCAPIRTRAGEILVPIQVPLLGEDGKLSSPGGGFTYQYTRMLIGKWTEGHRIEWTVSDKIEGDPDRTSRGLFEPALAELPDGRVLCIIRGSNGGPRDPDYQWPAGKWFSISDDGGHSWSKAELITFDDGSPLYSPSSMSQLLTYSDGRIFWIGNMNATNCKANNPRHPLVIGQFDPKSTTVIRDSILEIDSLRDDDTEGLSLSHWRAFEDRETQIIRIPMRRWNLAYKKFRGAEYEISVAAP